MTRFKSAVQVIAKTVAWLVGGLVVLVGVLAFGISYLEDPSRGEFFRNLVFDERAFEVTVDLVVEGEPVTITRTVNCVPYFRTGEFNFGQSWKASLESFGKRLKSGDAVIVVAPPLCGIAELPSGEDSRPIAIYDEYMPLIRWVDDPDQPTVIEDYISRGYHAAPNQRVGYKGMSARAVPYDSAATEPEDLDWFSAGRSNALNPRESVTANGYVVWPIPEGEWSKIDEIVDEIRALDQISVLSPEIVRHLAAQFSPQIHYDWIDRGQGLVPGPGPMGYGGSLRMKRDLAQIMPLTLNDGTFESNRDERGYLILYPIADNQPEDKDASEIQLEMDGQTFSIQATKLPRVKTIYVPKSRTVYQLVPLSKHIPIGATN